MAPKKASAIPPEKLALYEKLIATTPAVERKGDVHPYTSVNGHMFSYLDQTGAMGLRLAPEDLDSFLKKYKTKLFESYGVIKKDWAAVPDPLLKKTAELSKHFLASYRTTASLKPKTTKK